MKSFRRTYLYGYLLLKTGKQKQSMKNRLYKRINKKSAEQIRCQISDIFCN